MKAYSVDLRRKIVEALSTGTPKAQVARTFGVGLSTVKRYAGRAERGESLAPSKSPGERRKVDETAERLLERDLNERPTATLPQRRELLARVGGVEVSDSTFSRTLKRNGLQPKKRSLGAAERDEFLRAARRAMVAGEAGIEARRLVFVDECGANISLVPLYAWSGRGERAPAKAPRNWGKNVTLLSSMRASGGWVLPWRSKGRPPAGCSRHVSKRCSPRRFPQGRLW
jgi:transposase